MPDTEGKTLKKKLLNKMTVQQLKTLCSKLFKTELLSFQLRFKQEDNETLYELNDDIKELSFFCMSEDATIFVEPI